MLAARLCDQLKERRLSNLPEVREGFCPVPGGQLYYRVDGSGPTVAFIHAGIADLRMWDPQLPALTAHYQVLRYDCRGFGRTITEDVPFTNRADLIALLDHLGIARAAVVGCSRGGQIALDTALAYPERVSALVWVCGGIGGYQSPEEIFPPEELAFFTQMQQAEAAGDPAAIAALDVRFWVDGPAQPEGRADPAVREQIYAMALNNYQTVTVSGQAQPLEPVAAGRLAELDAPILAIVGDMDTVETAAAAEYLAGHAPHVRVEHFDQAAHVPSMEHPERFNRLLLEFLAALPA
jgi:pimeloyl-ACP methyl ester carboxylesterase